MPRVLVIEDEPAIAMVFQEFLSEEGYEVAVAFDGVAGLDRLRQGPLPDVVIVDLFMPGMGGREVIQSMRAEPLFAHVPVIVVTGAVPDAKDFPPEGSFQALLGKPFELKAVLQHVEQLTAAPASGLI